MSYKLHIALGENPHHLDSPLKINLNVIFVVVVQSFRNTEVMELVEKNAVH